MQLTVLTDPMIQPKPPDTSQSSMPALIRASAAEGKDITASASAAAPIALRYINPLLIPVARLGQHAARTRGTIVRKFQSQVVSFKAAAYFRFPQNRWIRRQASSSCGVA